MITARARLVPALLLGLVAFALYSRSLWSGFVYDAEAQIENDSYIHTPSHLADVVTFRVLAQDVLDGTRPVHLFFLMTDSLVWHRNPLGYHLTSNLLHAISAALLFLLLVRLAGEAASTQSPQRISLAAAAGTLIFIAHPVLVEAVSEVSNREDPLALFFTLCALTLAAHFPCRNRLRTIACGTACVASLVLAEGSKETGFAAPLLLILYAVAFRKFKPARAWCVLLGAALVVAGAFAVARFTLQPEHSLIFTSKPAHIAKTFGETLNVQTQIWTFLFSKTAWPTHLSADYVPTNITWIALGWARVALAAVLILQVFLSLKSRLALLGTAIFWLGLAPVSNFIPIYRPVADRFLYMPMAGVAVTICAALLLARREIAFRIFLIPVAAAAITLAVLTWQREAVFANPLNLWTDSAANSPFSATAADNLGYALSRSGKYQESLDSFARALQLSRMRNADAWAGAAISLQRLGRTSDARATLQKAVEIDARYGRPQDLVQAMVADQKDAAVLEEILQTPQP